MSERPFTIGVLGAGAIGAYLGVRLSAAGAHVVCVGRPWLVEARPLLRATGRRGRIVEPGPQLRCTTEVEALAQADACLVTVKAQDSEAAGRALVPVLPPQAPVLSLQNGLGNLEALRRAGLAAERLVGGMVTFNVVRDQDPAGRLLLRRATSGPIVVGPLGEPRLAAAFAAAGEPLRQRRDIAAIQRAKLLLNLNNGLCAVTGLSIKASIASPELRWCFARCIDEGLAVFRTAALPVRRIGPLSPWAVARLLSLPDALLRGLAPLLMHIDPRARSSTLQDLDRGRRTEIDYLNGEIARAAAAIGGSAPRNQRVTELVHAIERGERGHLGAEALRDELEGAAHDSAAPGETR